MQKDVFAFSQEFIANLLGSTRPSVSTAAGLLKEAGLIDYSRGVIRLIDLAKSKAGRANAIAWFKNHLDNYTEFYSGINEHHLSQVRN